MFVTRIELKNVSEAKSREVYDKLHVQLEKDGFKKQIKSNDGIWYQLPDATYKYEKTGTASTVNALAMAAAKAIGYQARSITFDYSTSSWEGLDTVTGMRSIHPNN